MPKHKCITVTLLRVLNIELLEFSSFWIETMLYVMGVDLIIWISFSILFFFFVRLYKPGTVSVSCPMPYVNTESKFIVVFHFQSNNVKCLWSHSYYVITFVLLPVSYSKCLFDWKKKEIPAGQVQIPQTEHIHHWQMLYFTFLSV